MTPLWWLTSVSPSWLIPRFYFFLSAKSSLQRLSIIFLSVRSYARLSTYPFLPPKESMSMSWSSLIRLHQILYAANFPKWTVLHSLTLSLFCSYTTNSLFVIQICLPSINSSFGFSIRLNNNCNHYFGFLFSENGSLATSLDRFFNLPGLEPGTTPIKSTFKAPLCPATARYKLWELSVGTDCNF